MNLMTEDLSKVTQFSPVVGPVMPRGSPLVYHQELIDRLHHWTRKRYHHVCGCTYTYNPRVILLIQPRQLIVGTTSGSLPLIKGKIRYLPNLHSKMYIVYNLTSPILAFVGSSNLVGWCEDVGLFELNVCVTEQASLAAINGIFQKLWDTATPI
jgi:hypothetical protein